MPWIALICALMLSTGCATIFSGRTQVVLLDSSPPGAEAKVHIGSTKIGNRRNTLLQMGELIATEKTPASVNLPRKNDYLVVFSLPDRPEVIQPLCKTTAGNPWILLNLLNLNIGLLVDRFSTGAAETLETNALALIPEKATGTSTAPLVCRSSGS